MNTSLLRFVTIASFLCINFFGMASSDPESSLFTKLIDLNSQWNKYENLAPTISIDFETDEELIQYHLEQVVFNLRTNSSASWSDSQLKNRIELIDVLEKYAAQKVFPTNLYHSTRTPYFIDDFGVHCAVGYLIQQSGNEKLALEISENFNYSYINDMQSLEMISWAKEYGFTLNELKWIQPTYAPTEPMDSVGNGANGLVKQVYADLLDDRLIIAGAFDSLDLQPCLNIGVYENDQLACLGGGLPGIVNDVIVTTDGVYVVGKLESSGTTFPLALYDGTSWSFFTISGRIGATGTSVIMSSTTEIQISIEHSIFINGESEIWTLSPANTWELDARVDGIILDAEVTNVGNVFVGHFNSFISYSATNPDTFQVTNVVIKEALVDNWYALGSGVSDTVKTIYESEAGIYFGGVCSNAFGASDVCLTRYLNDSLESILLKSDFIDTGSSSINAIAQEDSVQFIVGGEFSYSPIGGNAGTSLMVFHLGFNSGQGLAIFDGPVNSLAPFNAQMYFGGDFTSQLLNEPLNYLGRTLAEDAGLDEESFDINAYPNPFENKVMVEGFESNARYSLIDLSGKILMSDEILLDGILDFSNVENGVYVLRIRTSTGTFTERIVKSTID